MTNSYEGQDPLVIAQQAERDLNSHGAKHGNNNSLSGLRPATLNRLAQILKIPCSD